MKAAALLTAFALILLTSCVKVRTCECTRVDKLNGNSESKEVYTFRSKKKDAKTACDKYSEDTFAESITCSLK